jgi:hypothetical protein
MPRNKDNFAGIASMASYPLVIDSADKKNDGKDGKHHKHHHKHHHKDKDKDKDKEHIKSPKPQD